MIDSSLYLNTFKRSFFIKPFILKNHAVYNCEVIGKDDCSLCKSRGPKYGGYECVWCGQNCNFRNCSSNSKEEQCPFPSITEVIKLYTAIIKFRQLFVQFYSLLMRW